MKTYRLEREIRVPGSRDEVFAFFATAENLQKLTPPWLSFRILTETPVTMGAGTRIDYQLRLHGLPIKWTSEISAWDPPHRFVDRQLRGPYRLWVHEHTFEDLGAETLVRDSIDYAVPGGALVHRWFVKPDLQKVFDYRRQQMMEIFGTVV